MIVNNNVHLNYKADRFHVISLIYSILKAANSTEPDNLHLLDNRHL
jgi:hypothetical protein